jgi:N-acetyltransferase
MEFADLSNGDIELRVLLESDYDALSELAKDPEIWTYNPILTDPAQFKAKWFSHALRDMKEKTRHVYVVIQNHNIVGSTSFYHISEKHKRLDIGYTWFKPSLWGQGLNRITKIMMLNYAFKTLNFNRVGFCIDANNLRSCRATEKLGAVREGVLRHQMIRHDGSLRDTVMYSFIKEDFSRLIASLSAK